MCSSISTPFKYVAVLVLVLPGTPGRVAAAEAVSLVSGWKKGDATQVEVLLEVGGDVKLVDDGKTLKKPVDVVGKLRYEERLLTENRAASEPTRALRYYEEATAKLKIDTTEAEPGLRDERRLIGVNLHDEGATIYSPHGSLTRDELDLVDVIGQSLLIERLLPEKPVAVGDTWKHDNALLALLLRIDALSANDVVSKLVSVDEESAKMELTGIVNGAIDGVATEMELKAKIKFDRQLRRITWLALLIKEQRSIGHVGPGLDVVARLQVKLTPLAEPKHLGDQITSNAMASLESVTSLLSHEPAAGGVELNYARGWHIVGDTSDLLVMRYVERGELLAQCNVAPVRTIPQGGQITLAQFQNDVKEALADNFGSFHSATQSADSLGRTIYRVEVHGETNELPVQWNYYLISNGQGRYVVFAFTLEQALASRLGEADRAIVTGLRFLDGETAGRQNVTSLRR